MKCLDMDMEEDSPKSTIAVFSTNIRKVPVNVGEFHPWISFFAEKMNTR